MSPENLFFRVVRLPTPGQPGDRVVVTCSRRAQRFNLDLSSLLTFPSGKAIPIRLRNLSSGGLMGEAAEWFELGMEVLISVEPLGQLRTEIVWQMAGRFGASFLTPLTSAQLFAAGMTGLEQGRA